MRGHHGIFRCLPFVWRQSWPYRVSLCFCGRRFGFAGQGAKTAWACNQKMTKEDYDPAVALYTKQHSSPSSAVRNEEIYVEMPARCDLQPKLTPVQQRLLWEFPEHRLGRIPSALEAPEDRSPRKRAASKPPSPVG